jgi:hypothetical protein
MMIMMRHVIRCIGGAALTLALAATATATLSAQGQDEGAREPQTPRQAAPIDLEGYWVSIVNEDWRWRMVTPPAGDFASVPLNDEGERVGNQWTPAMDGQCEAYGVGGLTRIPGRLHITWRDPNTLQIDTDAGSQTRLLRFNATAPGRRSLQGHSVANWERPENEDDRAAGDAGEREPEGHLRVSTTNTTGGWLRKNGAPYSQNARVEESFDRFPAPNGDDWLVITTIVTDPTYLEDPFVTSTHFKREPDGSKWSPTECRD